MTEDGTRKLPIPELALVVLIGVTGSGKSSFAAKHFGRYEVISSDFCRGLVADDESDQSATNAAFEVLNFIAGKRLEAGRLTVIDATNVQRDARKHLVALARAHDVLPVAIVLDVPESVCVARNAARPDRDFGSHVVHQQHSQLRRSLRGLGHEGFRTVHILSGVEEIDAARVPREKLLNDYRHETGPFDVIGDVHGCRTELESLLDRLGYALARDESGRPIDAAHAGLKEAYHGRASGRVRSFALYGDTTGETDEFGLPVRYPWAHDYRGRAMVVYGHTPTPEPEWVNNTICLDTGCVFGGKLTALRYPEKQIVSVPAQRVWYQPVKPFPAASDGDSAISRRDPDLLDLTDVMGKRTVETAHHGRVSIREDNAAGALEVMSRFALHPRWLLYLPPTMAPCATSNRLELLEYPAEAFDAYRRVGVSQLICEEKHMGSRAVALVCRNDDVARTRFGATDGATGAVYTRTGRSFFDHDLTEQLLARLRSAIESAGLWAELKADWLAFDCELLPWSAKAQDLLRHQYAAVGAAARSVLPEAIAALQRASTRGLDVDDLLARTQARATNAAAFTQVYRQYCWPTDGLNGVKLAPFQLLASDTSAFETMDHGWHLGIADRLVAVAPELVQTTRRMLVDTNDAGSTTAATSWWEELTSAGGEGMVIKPHANLTRGKRGLVQPGLKVRGREYLRLIYGPDYTEPTNLERLRKRHLNHKRSLALREYALGIEALSRAVSGEPLWRIHEAVFAVLALESEAVDPRL